ncbi:hypothetical protein [Calycomorphotria hydatis]|uniref:Uncharacterized protein n=1 Tax=Calycomorphotria hydatis TaxID=2528027 RepID=A0A517TD36_9PLAN|nr:hypothetical protein [Calycomorphotria hydatis]QDT66290.1 hypothetical protein V22_35550 [Calycomorphotria hydatis]
MIYWVLGFIALLIVVLWFVLKSQCTPRDEFAAFEQQRSELETLFLKLARQRGKPRGLRWVNCDWQPEVVFAREVQTGLFTALAAVNISFEAVEGEDMEEVEAVGLLREASAVFHYQDGNWGTGGRALFNMHPGDAIERLEGQFEPVTPPSQQSLSGTA